MSNLPKISPVVGDGVETQSGCSGVLLLIALLTLLQHTEDLGLGWGRSRTSLTQPLLTWRMGVTSGTLIASYLISFSHLPYDVRIGLFDR